MKSIWAIRRPHSRVIVGAVLALVFLSSGLASPGATADDGQEIEQVPVGVPVPRGTDDYGERRVIHDGSVACERPAGAVAVSGGDTAPLVDHAQTPANVPPSNLWLEDDLVQRSLANAQRVLDARGSAVVGSFIDYEQRSLIVVYSPDQVIAADTGLQPALSEAVSTAAADVARAADNSLTVIETLDENERETLEQPSVELPARRGDGDLTIVLRPGCRSAGAIEELRSTIEAAAWTGEGDVAYTVTTDVATGQVVLGLEPDDMHLAAGLEAEHGDALRVEEGSFHLYGRLDDGSPHYGGARIHNRTLGGDCTSGFAMDRDGGRWMSTAAHCSTADWQFFYNNSALDVYFGAGRHRSTSGTDAALIGSGFHQYSRIIHVDPCNPCTRLVTTTDSNWVGQSICTSGSYTRASCGARVIDETITACRGGRCWTLRVGEHPNGRTIAQPGDSGGPVYLGLRNNRASIRGMIIGGPCLGACDTVYFNTVADVEAAVGAQVATTCCNSDSW